MANFKFNANFWVGIAVMIAVMVGLFYVAKGIFTILAWIAPVLFIITLIIRHEVVLSYGKMLLRLLKQNPLMGIAAIILTVIGFPVVAFALFGKAMLDRKIGQLEQKRSDAYRDEFTEYEELDDEPLDLPNMNKSAIDDNDYDDLISK